MSISTTTALLFIATLLILNIGLRDQDSLLKGLKTGVEVVGDDERVIANISTSNSNSLIRRRYLPAIKVR